MVVQPEPAEQRTQVERSRVTRLMIMEAAVQVLEEEGLSRATTLRIQERAGVTRGRLLHHFPSRSDLLVAAVQHLAEVRFASTRRSTSRLRGRARADAAIDGLWLTYEGPLFWAAMELWLGSRTDPSLRAALSPQEAKLGVVVDQLCDELFGDDLAQRPGYTEFRDILITSMRGVAMTYAIQSRSKATDPHRQLWRTLARQMLDL